MILVHPHLIHNIENQLNRFLYPFLILKQEDATYDNIMETTSASLATNIDLCLKAMENNHNEVVKATKELKCSQGQLMQD